MGQAGCRQGAGRVQAGGRQGAGRVQAGCRQGAGRGQAGCRAGCRQGAGRVQAGCRQGAGRVQAGCRRCVELTGGCGAGRRMNHQGNIMQGWTTGRHKRGQEDNRDQKHAGTRQTRG